MGVAGLLPQLKSIQQPVTLHRYRSQSLAIDGYAWLHRSAHSCAMELCMGLPTDRYLQFFIKRLTMLRNHYNIEPYVVFDGDSIQVKSGTEAKRREKRMENKALAVKLWESGERRRSVEFFQKCVEITPEMTKVVIDYCAMAGFKYVVAPYEADPQLVYLEQCGLVQGVISEDSDLLVFGCRRLITKLNDHGECIEISRDDFQHLPSKFPLGRLSAAQIRSIVCLAGCDYTSGIPQVGLMTAVKLVLKYRTMEKVILGIQREGKWKVPEDFMQEYRFADLAFQFQRVYCPVARQLVTLNVIPESLVADKMIYECIGKAIHRETGEKCVIQSSEMINHELHARIAMGELNPYNFRQPLVNREHKLQLVSKSDLQLQKPPARIATLDSYMKKARKPKDHQTSTVDSPIPTCTVSNTDRIVMNRKLAPKAPSLPLQESSFFQAKPGAHRPAVVAREPTDENRNDNKTIPSCLDIETVQEKAETVSAICSAPPTQHNNTAKKPNFLAEPQAECPSPTDVTFHDTSEILEELEEFQNKKKRAAAAVPSNSSPHKSLFAKFKYNPAAPLQKRPRVPLGERDTNCKMPDLKKMTTNKLNKRILGATKRSSSKLPTNVPRNAFQHSSAKTTAPRPILGALATAKPVQGTRQLSLSDFIYKS